MGESMFELFNVVEMIDIASRLVTEYDVTSSFGLRRDVVGLGAASAYIDAYSADRVTLMNRIVDVSRAADWTMDDLNHADALVRDFYDKSKRAKAGGEVSLRAVTVAHAEAYAAMSAVYRQFARFAVHVRAYVDSVASVMCLDEEWRKEAHALTNAEWVDVASRAKDRVNALIAPGKKFDVRFGSYELEIGSGRDVFAMFDDVRAKVDAVAQEAEKAEAVAQSLTRR